MKNLFIFSSLIIFILSNCKNPGKDISLNNSLPENNLTIAYNDTLSLNDTLLIKYNNTLFDEEENIWVTFDSIVTDSRCPINVVCFWEGNAELSFVFSNNVDAPARFKLNTHSSFTTDTTLFDYSISLIDVLPYPHTDSSYVAGDYSAKIFIAK